VPDQIEHADGRRLFGADPTAYDQVRPAYPDWIFTDLVAAGALFEGAATLEIGAGSGLASRPLLAYGANPLILLEPDQRFARSLAAIARQASGTCTICHEPFESAALTPASFDLIVAATAFHWLEPESALMRAHQLLKPNGTVALIWNVLQVMGQPDPFHDATAALLAPLATSPAGAPDTLPFALDRSAREAQARAAGFEEVVYRESRWSMTLESDQVVQLYQTFSSVQHLSPPERASVLASLKAIADDQFGGRVTRNVTSCLYRIR